MADGEDRSSLSTLWKKGKERLKGKDSKDPARGAGNIGLSEDGSTPSDKVPKAQSQTRRAQVRSAQIRHRQRKANYQKELELDAAKYRDLITQAEVETTAMRRENEAIRAALRNAGIDISQQPQPTSEEEQAQGRLQSMQIDPYTSTSPGLGGGQTPAPTTPELFSNIDVNDLTVSLSMEDIMGTPAFHISSSSSGTSFYSGASPSRSDEGWWLSRAQEDSVINFVLALEHVCWDHFGHGDFPQHNPTASEDEKDPGHGHALMASTLCMAHAPDSVYEVRGALEAATPRSGSASPPLSLQWQSSGISLAKLRGLASSLNPGDAELTPVQAWFELAERYPPVSLLEGGVLERLKREFKGVVRCVAYGAAIERGAFESIVGRVIREFTPGA